MFRFFHKKPQLPAPLTAQEMLRAARERAERENETERHPAAEPAEEAESSPYRYVHSWEKTQDPAPQEQEVVINAQGVATRLQELLAPAETAIEPENTETRYLSDLAAKKFMQALSPDDSPRPDPVPPVPPLPTARFSERLRQGVGKSVSDSA